MELPRSRCALGVHRYVYSGVLLGQRLERCVRCGKIRTSRLTLMSARDDVSTESRGAADRDLVVR